MVKIKGEGRERKMRRKKGDSRWRERADGEKETKGSERSREDKKRKSTSLSSFHLLKLLLLELLRDSLQKDFFIRSH